MYRAPTTCLGSAVSFALFVLHCCLFVLLIDYLKIYTGIYKDLTDFDFDDGTLHTHVHIIIEILLFVVCLCFPFTVC